MTLRVGRPIRALEIHRTMHRAFIPFLLLATMPIATLRVEAQEATTDARVVVTKDIEFAKPNGRSLKLDLYQPRHRSGPTPVVIFVHGGGWKNGSRQSAAKQAKWLAHHGYTMAGIDYRLTHEAQWPSQIEDCYAAVRWLRRHADQHHLDANHIEWQRTLPETGQSTVCVWGDRLFFTTMSPVQKDSTLGSNLSALNPTKALSERTNSTNK